MSERFGAIILGGGPAAEVALDTLALVEGELIGGQCSNWGCRHHDRPDDVGTALRSLPGEAAPVGSDHCAHLRVAEPTAGVG